jgi:hypothetical protein
MAANPFRFDADRRSPAGRPGTIPRRWRWQPSGPTDNAMSNIEQQLAEIGFGEGRRETVSCWRAVRLDRAPVASRERQHGPEPACSAALLRWRDLLAREPLPPPYRISRA